LITSLIYSALSAIVAGVIGGSAIVFFVRYRSRNKHFLYGTFLSALTFIIVYLIVAIIVSLTYNHFKLGIPFYTMESIKSMVELIISPLQMRSMLVWTILVACTQLILQISDKFGPGVLWDMIRGKYLVPREEERIFMFLDINNSTEIAEQLGHRQYHSLLNSFFTDITDPVINRHGAIYQYVGDEVVISWKSDIGKKEANCIHCYFDIEDRIERIGDSYKRIFGIVPSFKAGIHVGTAAVGEVGFIKRDIVFSGDVLNTAARIQETCKKFDANILTSQHLIDQLEPDPSLVYQSIGSITLKGKKEKVELVRVSKHRGALSNDSERKKVQGIELNT